MRIFGLMSGTSLDGIDVADVEVRRAPDGRLAPALLHFETIPFGLELRRCLVDAQPPADPSSHAMAELDVAVGEALAGAVLGCAQRWDVPSSAIDAIGSHGVTVWHAPELSATVQIGKPAVIAARTGVTCVGDFRSADVAAGGQGAPLVPFADWHLFGSASETRAALNIGGIANLTVLDAGAPIEATRAFDTGPGNMVIDECARETSGGDLRFDEDGAMAQRGTVAIELLDELMDDAFVRKPPPKSTGRERYGANYCREVMRRGAELDLRPEDLVATLTALTAHTIARQVPAGCARLIASGGGVHNRALMAMLVSALAAKRTGIIVETSAAHGLDPDAKEAVAFALLAYETLAGRPNHVPACTGSRSRLVLGTIAPGANYAALMRAAFGAKQA